MGLGKLGCCKNFSGCSVWNWQPLLVCCDWLVACIISYHAFGLLTGCLGQFCLLIVILHVLACACIIVLPHLTLFILFLLGTLVGIIDFYILRGHPVFCAVPFLGWSAGQADARLWLPVFKELVPWRSQKVRSKTFRQTRALKALLYLC